MALSEFQGIIEKAHILKFRKFIDLEIKCGRKLTVIAGQNGTQKTTLLGLLAHPFSMSKKNPDDENIESMAEDGQEKDFSEAKTIQGHTFQSKFARKFKLIVLKNSQRITNTLYICLIKVSGIMVFLR